MDEQANALAVRTHKVIGLPSALKKRSVTLYATLRQIQGLYAGLFRGLRPPTWALLIHQSRGRRGSRPLVRDNLPILGSGFELQEAGTLTGIVRLL